MARHHHSLGDEATSAGLLGATAVAAWFLLLDLIAGRPLHIASVFGQVLLFGDRTPELARLHWGAVEAYGFFHFLSFLAVAWLAVRLLHMAVRQPVWLFGLLLLFVTLETAAFAVSFVLFQGTGAEYLRAPVLIGGPVQQDRGFVLHETDDADWDSTFQVSDRLSVTTSRDILAALAEGRGPRRSLLALGYAGWSEGQLESELQDNAWLAVAADATIVFDTPLEQRWSAAARLMGVDLSLLTDYAGHA